MAGVTLSDIAKKAKVSLATVSLVLSNGNIRVGEKTRERIHQIAKELNYIPNASARTLRTGKFNTIAVITYDITDAFAAECMLSMEAYLENTPYRASWISCAHKKNTDPGQMLQELSGSVDGIVVIAADNYLKDSDLLHLWSIRKMPIVSIIRRLPGDLIPSVRMSNDTGMRLILDHLYQLGHRRIALCYNKFMHPSASQRFQTYKAYLGEHELPDDPSIQIPVDITLEDGFAAGLQILKCRPRPTAIVAFNDLGAMGLISAMSRQGINVPEDISIAGFDNIRMAKFCNPSLTSVAADYNDFGKLSLDKLFSLIDDPDLIGKDHSNIIIKPEIKIRNSTAAVSCPSP